MCFKLSIRLFQFNSTIHEVQRRFSTSPGPQRQCCSFAPVFVYCEYSVHKCQARLTDYWRHDSVLAHIWIKELVIAIPPENSPDIIFTLFALPSLASQTEPQVCSRTGNASHPSSPLLCHVTVFDIRRRQFQIEECRDLHVSCLADCSISRQRYHQSASLQQLYIVASGNNH